jgi:hypothetical protein
MANGRRVVLDGAKSTRHIIAGLAQALAGVLCSRFRVNGLGLESRFMAFEPDFEAPATSSQDWHRCQQVRCCCAVKCCRVK